MAGTILKLGWTNPLSGAFGDHPSLGTVLDLNDGVTFTLAPDGLELEAPVRTIVTSGNVRTQGERGTRAVYRHNRRLAARVSLGPMASSGDLVANVRALLAWLNAPPQQSVALQYQPLNASSPVYLDVVAAAHSIPSDEGDWLRVQLDPVELVFLVRPGLRGDRVTLSNLVPNPGFEAPAGGGTAQVMPTAFADSFANTNAYTVVSGSAPSVSGNVMTIPANTILTFGSPAWGAIQLWQVRYKHVTGVTADFNVHRVDGNNRLVVEEFNGGIGIYHVVGGTVHTLASASPGLTNGNWYWMIATQFPSPPGDPPFITVTFCNDSGGSIGSQLASIGGPTWDAVTALGGVAGIQCAGGALQVGGPFVTNVTHYVALFGPGGWQFNGNLGSGSCSGAWDGTRGELGMSGAGGSDTYPGGPVTSCGAARIDLPPAGTANATWNLFGGGSPSGTQAIPVTAAGNVMGASVWIKTTGLGASAAISLIVSEYSSGGAYLRQTSVAARTGNQSAWTQLAGSVTTGASCAYVDLAITVADTSGPGASANATVLIDNAQCWNATTSGSSAMPYCELRFPQSPAQLVVSGLLGDLPAPAFLALGTYLASWATGATLSLALGRRAQLSANAQLVAASHGFYGTTFAPQATAVLDATSYGGYYAQATVTSAGWNPRAFSPHPADAQGTYHLFERHLTKQSAPNLPNVQVRVVAQQLGDAWYGNANGTDQLGAYTGAWATPLTSSNAWTMVDAGQVTIPPLGTGAMTDLAQTYVTPRPQWTDATGGGAPQQASWQMLLPVDGSLVMGVLNNPSNAPFAVASQWLWSYVDALAVASGGVAAWTYSLEAALLPYPAHAGGGPGTQSTGAINLNAGADPYLTLDPTQQLAGNGGVNQLVAYIADGAATVLPLAAEIQYTPLYLWPR